MKRIDLVKMWFGNARVSNFNPNNQKSNVNNDNANNENDNRGVRGLLKVYKLCKDFSQPPSILPISAAVACIGKAVSFNSFNSSKSLNFRLKLPNIPALIKYMPFVVWSIFAIIAHSINSRCCFRTYSSEFLAAFFRCLCNCISL